MRRVHVPDLRPGVVTPDAAQSHHLRSVLRLTAGETVEAFDAAGRRGDAVVLTTEPAVTLRVDAVAAPPPGVRIVVAAAVPKGDRADWMVEKLGEIGVAAFIPLRTARSVVHPDGPSKFERWRRIAIETAKQCQRAGVLEIGPLTDLAALLPTLGLTDVYCSTRPGTPHLREAIVAHDAVARTLLIGPEGDWTPAEETAFAERGLTPAGLGRTILRVETAAVLAAGLMMLLSDPEA